MQSGECEQSGEYAPVTDDHDVMFDKKERFNKGDTFPGDWGWVWVGD